VHRFLALLPFDLTGAQRRVLAETSGVLASCKKALAMISGPMPSPDAIAKEIGLLTSVPFDEKD
jgi:RecG-like helicase